VISTVDPQARHVHKTVHHRQDGYKGHVAVEPDTGLFTGGKLTQASGEDNHEAVVGLALLDEQDGELEVLGDSAYGTGDARAALAANKHAAVIKPTPLRPAVSDGFTIDDFTVDEASGAVTCPHGVTKHITPKRAVVFGASCHDCPLRRRCTASKTGRTLHLHPHDARLRQARRDWRDNKQLREVYRQHRPMVERSIAWLIGPKGRCRQLRYRGVTAGDWWLHTRMAALNLRRLLNLGLTRHTDAWILI
jgi:DDE family transposase